MAYCNKYTKCVFGVILSFTLICSVNATTTGKYPIKNFTPAEYMAGNQNIDFAQNRDMNLFVANNLGVLSYNGNEWERHAFQTGKKQRSLTFDEHKNRLYVGSQGDFGYFEDDWNYVSLIDKIPPHLKDFDEVWDVFLLNSNVYFCTFQGIYVYDGQSVSVIENPDGFNRSFKANGKLFTQNRQGKLLEIKENKLEASYQQNQRNQIINGIITEKDGYLLFYNSGAIEFTNSFGVTIKHEDLITVLKGKYVNHVLQLSDSRLAISTQTSGLFLYDMQNGSMENITTQDGLQTNACLRAFQDYSGNLWVGMQNGIALIDINSPMRLINREIDIQGSGYDAYDTDSGTYFTTSSGIYYLAKNAAKSVFLSGTEGPSYGIQEIAGKLYAGHHSGLFLLENGRAEKLATTDGLWQIKQLRTNPEFAVGGTYSGLFLFKINADRMLQAVHKIEGFNESSRFFEEDNKGRIWVGQFYKGLYQLTLSQDLIRTSVTKTSTTDDRSIDDQVILSKLDNNIYFGTNTGLYLLDQTTDRIVPAENFSKDIGNEQVYLLVQDKEKNIHVFTESLVGFFKQISNHNYVFVPSSISQLRYSFNNDLLNIAVNIDKGVLFNANEGFIQYDADKENRIAVDQPPVISKVYSVTRDSILYARKPFEQRPEMYGRLAVNQKDKVIQFNVESFQFNGAGNQKFQYHLKGFDAGNGDWSHTTTKEYTNLKEGKYEFAVSSSNYWGKVSTSPPLLLKAHPPFYKSFIAKVLYALLALSALFFVSRFQRGRYNKKATKIEEAKQREIAKKQQKLVEIEAQREKEVRKLKEEKMASELRHLNNLLAASTMNLVVKNEFMENIKEELNEVKRKGKSADTKQALEHIVKEIDTTLRVQEDWEQFEHHFDNVHGDFSTRLRDKFLDLSPNDHKLSAFLRLNLNTKEIANLMGISTRGVEIARYRLRKKLGLQKGQNLSKFILEY